MTVRAALDLYGLSALYEYGGLQRTSRLGYEVTLDSPGPFDVRGRVIPEEIPFPFL